MRYAKPKRAPDYELGDDWYEPIPINDNDPVDVRTMMARLVGEHHE
jgi:hypothetical protein